MFAYLYIYIFAYLYICIFTYVFVHIFIYLLIYIYIYIFTYLYIQRFTDLYICMFTYVFIYIFIYLLIFISTQSHICKFTCLYFYIFTYSHIYIFYISTYLYIYMFTYLYIGTDVNLSELTTPTELLHHSVSAATRWQHALNPGLHEDQHLLILTSCHFLLLGSRGRTDLFPDKRNTSQPNDLLCVLYDALSDFHIVLLGNSATP